ncbi:uncharacterized protein LOC133315593 [Gastrolobium bilobum]|uniref:uncharacterized protein LOC133315593 n=1 Tax=Gastrolobium bilobum TaxID=150636 RepID=UPI002AB20E61|nr:uncharacterized protein LOC133315593 [Gastrolobium bilobum]
MDHSSSASASASNSATAATSASDANELLDKPLWKYVTRIDAIVEEEEIYLGCKGIGKCLMVQNRDLIEMEKLEQEADQIKQSNAPIKVPLPPSSSSTCPKKRKTTGSLEMAFNVGEREELNYLIARMFYSAGLPFNLAKNPYFQASYTYAANHNIGGYLPPGYNSLRTTVLQKEKENIDKLCEPIRESWAHKGVSIVSDGWSDSQRRPLINFMAVSDGRAMFLKSVDCSGEIKDKNFIFSLFELLYSIYVFIFSRETNDKNIIFRLLKEVIQEVGEANMVQVITDNAANCKGAGQLIEQEFPTITWTLCVVHALNLAVKNICVAKNVESNQITYEECSWIYDIVGDVAAIKHFIMNHSMRLAIFNEFVSLKLLSIANTCFASMIVMLKRFKLIKSGLQNMVISEKWNIYRDDNLGRARHVKEKLLDDCFWDSVDYILAFTAPIYDMIRACDTDRSCLHLIYDILDAMIVKVKKAIYHKGGKRMEESSSFYDVVHRILVDRWTKNSTLLHCLAHALNPKYYNSQQWLQEDSSRVPPHMDLELTQERQKCLRRFFPSMEDRSRISLEYADFISNSETFDDFDAINTQYTMDSKSWWLLYGTFTPMLQKIALRLVQQPSSSSCAERNWSTYSFVHSIKRNKITPKRAEDLVYVHSNLRLLSRKTPSYAQGTNQTWDIAGDTFDSLDDIGNLQFASLSLDEPEIEAMIIEDGDENN